MTPFEHAGLQFTLDRHGLELEGGHAVEIELDYADLDMDPDDAPAQLGHVLTRLFESTVADEEGLFDLAVHRDGVLVATLALACEDEMLEILGERATTVSEAALAEALLENLTVRGA